MTQEPHDNILLKVDRLVKHFPISRGMVIQKQVGTVYAVDDVSFELPRGDKFGIIGESGCGKSTLARTILQVEKPTSGHVYFEGKDLVSLREDALRQVRQQIRLISQDSNEDFNQAMNMEQIIGELFMSRTVVQPEETERRVLEIIKMVGLNLDLMERRPTELSVSQRQNFKIAKLLAWQPSVIICDGGISQLDPSLQSRIINIFEDLHDKNGASFIFIDENFSLVRHFCDRVAVMYLGILVEMADSSELYRNPLHPYTQALLSAFPIPDPVVEERHRRIVLEGDLPSSSNPPSGCRFRSRCQLVEMICAEETPELKEVSQGHFVACHMVNHY
jgi:oligopeptide transport system ATP-binding protein